MDEYIGIVKLFAGPYVPQNYMLCNGAILSIAQYQALYAVIGITYGGNGSTTFALPDLQGRVAVGAGNGTGIPNVTPGQADGSATVTLQTANMPAHTHLQQFANIASTTNSPSGNVLAQITAADNGGIALTASGYAPAGSLVPGDPQAISPAGGSQPFSAIPPYLGMNYIICVNGLFPSRS